MSCSPGMRGCRVMCAHRALVDDYRQERERQDSELWEMSFGYSTEYEDNKRARRDAGQPLITFKQWLIQSRRIKV